MARKRDLNIEGKVTKIVEEQSIEEVAAIEEPAVPVIKHVKDTRLRVRKFPVIGDNIIRLLEPHSEVCVYEEIEGWARISEDQSEYVMTEFLR